MSDEEAEHYAVQKRWYLIQKATNTFSDSELTDLDHRDETSLITSAASRRCITDSS